MATTSVYVFGFQKAVDQIFRGAAGKENIDIQEIEKQIEQAYKRFSHAYQQVGEPTLSELADAKNFYIESAPQKIRTLVFYQQQELENVTQKA